MLPGISLPSIFSFALSSAWILRISGSGAQMTVLDLRGGECGRLLELEGAPREEENVRLREENVGGC